MRSPLDRRNLAGGGLVALVTVVSVALYPQLPERMAVHFGSGGQPDGYLARP